MRARLPPLLLVAVAACGGETHQPARTAPIDPAAPAEVAATPPVSSVEKSLGDSGSSVTLTAGTSLTVTLRAAAGTGYSWDLAHVDDAILATARPVAHVPDHPGLAGGQASTVFAFTAKTKGTTRLEIVFHRPWLHGPPDQAFTLDVRVE